MRNILLSLLLPVSVVSDVLHVLAPDDNEENCPRYPDCCEEDCCGPGTSFYGDSCLYDPGSPGWLGVYSPKFERGCVQRSCCEEECCSEGTIYDPQIACCIAEPSLAPSLAPTTQAQAECNVKISGPSCVAYESGFDVHDFKAEGTPGGGDYSWEFPAEDPTKYYIVAGSDEQTVSVQTVKESTAADDVTLKVTYTVNDKTCEAFHSFTIISATLTFKDAGTWTQPENDLKEYPKYGDPNLGVIVPGTPVNARGFHKSIEIEATISPCVELPKCKFDFKREKQGYSATIENGVYTNSMSSPPPAWGNDDDPSQDSVDEDLKLEKAEGCKLYVVDIPGIHASGACTPEDKVWFNYKNYREWLNVDGHRCSWNVNWRASTRIKCVETPADSGKYEWQVDDPANIDDPNDVGEGHFGTLYKPAGARRRLLGNLPFDLENVLGLLKSDESSDRLLAEAIVLQEAQSGGLDTNAKATLEKTLVLILKQSNDTETVDTSIPVKAGSEAEEVQALPIWSMPCMAVRLAGALQAKEALPLILDRIAVTYPTVITDKETEAARAVALYGRDAINPIIERASFVPEREWWGLIHALLLMNEHDAVQEAIELKESMEMNQLTVARLEHLKTMIN